MTRAVLLIVICFCSCKTLKSIQVDPPVPPTALDGKWTLHSIIGAQSNQLFAADQPFLQFNSNQKRVTGKTGCNHLTGSYELMNEKGLAFGSIATTKMACNDNGKGEAIFVQTLNEVDQFVIDAGELVLEKNGQELLRFCRQPE